jgi:hypothetical protein
VAPAARACEAKTDLTCFATRDREREIVPGVFLANGISIAFKLAKGKSIGVMYIRRVRWNTGVQRHRTLTHCARGDDFRADQIKKRPVCWLYRFAASRFHYGGRRASYKAPHASPSQSTSNNIHPHATRRSDIWNAKRDFCSLLTAF